MHHGIGSAKWRVRLWAYAPLVLWIGVIFLMSSSQGSMSETSRIIGPLLQFFFPDMPEGTRLLIHGYVRKSAHFIEYAVLAFFALRALSMSASVVLRRWRYALALLLVILIAAIDEVNQSFDSSRTGAITDVMIDTTGGVAMMVFLWLIKRPRMSEPPA